MRLKLHMTGEVKEVSEAEATDLLRQGIASKIGGRPKKAKKTSPSEEEKTLPTNEDSKSNND